MRKIILVLLVLIAIVGCGSEENKTLNGKVELKLVSSDDNWISMSWNSIPDVAAYTAS